MSNEALNVTLGTHELRPWVLKMIDVKAEQVGAARCSNQCPLLRSGSGVGARAGV